MSRYQSYAGLPAVLDNLKDVAQLGRFLREYKLINAQTQADTRFLEDIQAKIYQDLVERVRGYNRVSDAVAVQRRLLQAVPADRRLQADLAALLSQSPDGYAEALSLYQSLLKSHPDDFRARAGLVRLQVAMKNPADALPNYQLLLKARPHDFSVQLEYARLLVELNREAEALPYLNQMAEAAPESYAAKVELARIAVRAGDLSGADERLTAILNSPKLSLDVKRSVYKVYRELIRQQDDPARRRRYAMLFSQDKRTFAWSIAEYRDLLEDGRAEPGDRLALARVLSWDQQYEAAVKIYRDLLPSDPNATAILAELAGVLRWAGWYPEALLVTDRLIALQPSSLEYKLEKARLLKETKRFDESFRIYQEVADANPSQIPIRLEYARALHESGRSEQACREYAELLPLVSDADVHLEYARALAAQHRYAESDRVYQALLAEKPDDAALKLEYAQALAWRNDFKAAEQFFRAGTKNVLAARRTFAKLLFWNGKYEEARAECLSLLNLTPNDRELQFDAARALVRLEQFEEALNELEQLRAEYPGDKEIAAEYAQAVARKGKRAKEVEKPEAANEAEPETMPAAPKAISKRSRPIMIAPIRTETKMSKKERASMAKGTPLLAEEADPDARRLESANQALWAQRYREAIRMYRALIADAPGELEAHLGLAEALLYSDDYAGAYRIFRRVLDQDPTNVRARYGLAQLYAYGGKMQNPNQALRELKQVFALSFTHLPAYETYADLTREMSRSLNPFSQNHLDSDRYARFAGGADYRYPVSGRTFLIGYYRYDVVRQEIRRRFADSDFADWFGQPLTGRSYEFGIKQRLTSRLQWQAGGGGTNFNWGRSYLNASAALEVSPHPDHLISLGYEREPGVFFLNTVMALGAGLYGHRFQLGHTYSFRPRWEFSQNYQYTRLTSNHRYGAPDNAIKQAGAALRYKLSKAFSLGSGYSFTGFRDHSSLYYSPHGDHSASGEFAYQKSNRVVGFGLSASAGKIFMSRNRGYFIAAKSDLTFHPAPGWQLDLSYQPLYSHAGSAFGFHLYRYHMFLLNLRYWLDRANDRVPRIPG